MLSSHLIIGLLSGPPQKFSVHFTSPPKKTTCPSHRSLLDFTVATTLGDKWVRHEAPRYVTS